MILTGNLSRRFFVFVVVLPAVFFCLLGGYYMSQGSYLYGQLKSDDCSGGGFLPQKRELQEAYDAALKLYSGCMIRTAESLCLSGQRCSLARSGSNCMRRRLG